MLSKSEILKKGDYYIEYNFDVNKKNAKINISWKDSGAYVVKYDPDKKQVITNWRSQHINCTPYSAPSIVWLVLNDICLTNKYPLNLVQFKINDNTKTSFIFDIYESKEDTEQASYIFELAQDIIKEGVLREHVDLSKSFQLWDDYKPVCEYYLNVSIN